MPHMLAQEHMAYVDALRYGTTRDITTLNAALAAIGSTPAALIFTNTGNGVWNFTANFTTPTNVMIIIPIGVTINGPAGVTWSCGGTILAYGGNYLTGGMFISKSAVSPAVETSVLFATTMKISNGGSGSPFSYDNGAGASAATVSMFQDQVAGTAGVQISRNISVANSTWQWRTVTNGDMQFLRPGAGTPVIVVNNNGLGLLQTTGSAFALDVNSDQVAKVTAAGGWLARTSDERVKTKRRLYSFGTDYISALPPSYYFTFTGAGGTPNDGKEYVSMMAGDVQSVAPEFVFATTTYLDGDPNPLLSLDLGNLQAAMVNAIRELNQRVTALESPTSRTEDASPPSPRRKQR